jgi:hypothetical protein
MNVERSKTGKPTVTENGGGMSNTGYATIICGNDGKRLKPIFVPRGYSNGEHAIFVIIPGQTCFVSATRNRRGENATICRITKINEDDTLEHEMIGEYENGDGNIPDNFQPAVTAALEKAKCYHCREAHYIKQ